MKITLNRIDGRLSIKHCRSKGSKLEDTTKETIQYETQREKRTFFNEVSCGSTPRPSPI